MGGFGVFGVLMCFFSEKGTTLTYIDHVFFVFLLKEKEGPPQNIQLPEVLQTRRTPLVHWLNLLACWVRQPATGDRVEGNSHDSKEIDPQDMF